MILSLVRKPDLELDRLQIMDPWTTAHCEAIAEVSK